MQTSECFDDILCLGDRLHSVHVGVMPYYPGSPMLGTYPLCGKHPGIVDSFAAIMCFQHTWGRYVTVQIASGAGTLILCEVEVYQTIHTG